ncbi:uncharacterized protein LOC126972870 isoform X1 [Leptidea sinapis]|uniref:uncharacterized protein LOC126972870 isoform X1 n=1 Tax=Leptidea sinapis TaxID=189913 RepID=UPI0021C2BA7D|nr:uncharacterized protein LOC126972870 isoform X1 [Leptidea sinapis]
MVPPKLIILLFSTALCLASHHSHTIPVEGYETELHDLGEHVHIPETPVRVIKITKTVAVKVPVPYPVKVVEKVPYPVHINRPYPIPVPHIVKVPHAIAPKAAEYTIDGGQEHGHPHQHQGYQVQENEYHEDGPHPYQYAPYNGVQGDSYNNPSGQFVKGASDNSYNEPSDNYGNDDQDIHNTLESKNYNVAIQNYLNGLNSNIASHNKNY